MSKQTQTTYEEAFWVLAGMFINTCYLLNDHEPLVAVCSAQALGKMGEDLGIDVETMAERALAAFEARAEREKPKNAVELSEMLTYLAEIELEAQLSSEAPGTIH